MTTPILQSGGDGNRFLSGLDQTVCAVDIIPVTPSNTVNLERMARAIRAMTGGTLRITSYSGEVRNTYISDGEILPVCAVRIHATGTSATGIEVLL